MKPAERQQRHAVDALEPSDWDDDNDFKDVYYPDFDAVPGETSTVFLLRYAFACGGFRVISVEEASTHPVLIIHAVRTNCTRTDERLLFRQLRALLRNAGHPVRRDELIVGQVYGRLLISFPWRYSSINYAAALRQADADAAELEGMPL